MPIGRVFLDWQQPALASASRYLADRYAAGGVWNLEHVAVVTPGSRAGRQLLEHLVLLAEERGLELVPPRIETAGRLPELLFRPKRPYASDLVQQLAWADALQRVGPSRLAELTAHWPAANDWSRWLELSRLLWRLHRELAGEMLNFADVVAQLAKDVPRQERQRWKLLAEIQQFYWNKLDSLELWDQQTARLEAIKRGECETQWDIILLAVADLNLTARRMLEQVGSRVTALVFAPESLADRFDEHGCLVPQAWLTAEIPLEDAQLHVVEGPREQAVAVGEQLARWSNRFSAGEIVVGVPDPRLTPVLERHLEERGVGVHVAAGLPLAETAPCRLLAAIADWLARPRYRQMAALLRHPTIYGWLTRDVPAPWLTQLDEYYNAHLPPQLATWLGTPHERNRIEPAIERLTNLLAPLRGALQPLKAWAPVLANILAQLTEHLLLDEQDPRQQRELSAWQAIQAALELLETPPADLSHVLPATEAIRLVLDQLRDQRSAAPATPECVELLGWLDLPLDHSPCLVLTTFNEGFVPTSVNADLFLPNNLRRRLQLVDNQRRYARDAYALQSLVSSRREVTLLVAQRDAAGDPLVPSRLALACDPATIARRVLRFTRGGTVPGGSTEPGDGTAQTVAQTAAGDADGSSQGAAPSELLLPDTSKFIVPAAAALPRPLTQFPVTSFRAYLACPYRFYLRYGLRLQALDDQAEELQPTSFGSLLHKVLESFALSDLTEATEVEPITGFLDASLTEAAEQQFGAARLAPVNLQIRQLRARLHAFACWQAQWAAEGWRIKYCERPCLVQPTCLQVQGHVIELKGTIDRIDFNPQTGQWAILDYKSSDAAKGPEQVHRRGGAWVDLQLPLYRHLAQSLDVPLDAQLGYILLPKDLAKVGCAMAEWTADDLLLADQVALDVIHRVLAEQFEPSDEVPIYPDEFSDLCQDHVFAPPLRDVELEGRPTTP